MTTTTTATEANKVVGEASPRARRGDRSERSSPADPHSDCVPREKVRELLRAMAAADYARLLKRTRWNADTHWARIEAAVERIHELEQELGL